MFYYNSEHFTNFMELKFNVIVEEEQVREE